LVLTSADQGTLIAHIEKWASDNDLLLDPSLFEELARAYHDILAGKDRLNCVEGVLHELTKRMAQIEIGSEQSRGERAEEKNLVGRHRETKTKQPPQHAGGSLVLPSDNERISVLQKQVDGVRAAWEVCGHSTSPWMAD